MSHEIQSAVFSAREGAGWTGLGQVIPATIANDPAKIAELLGATYKVVTAPAYYKDANGNFRLVKDRKFTLRDDTGETFEAVSTSRYHLDNRQPSDIVEAFRDEIQQNGLEISHAAVLRGGAQIAVCALLPSDFDLMVGGTDRVQQYVTLSTGYDTKHGTKCGRGNVRVVCANTLAMSINASAKTDQLRTIRASTMLEDTSLSDLIARVQTLQAVEAEQFDAFANHRLSNDAVARYFADVLEIDISKLNQVNANGGKLVSTKAENMLKELSAAYASAPGAAQASGTVWGALNAVTYYATHIKTVRDTKADGTDAARCASNLDGDAAKLKLRALSLAAQYVPALAVAA